MAINKDRIVQHHQRPRGAGQPAAAAVDAGLRPRTTRATPTTSKAPRRCWPRPASPTASRPSSTSTNTDPNPRIAQAIQQDLAAIGIKAEIQSLAQANVIAAGGDEARAPMIWSGGMAWIADFPDPSNFYGPILGCARRGAGRLELVVVLQRGARRQGDRGRRMTDPAKADERLAAVVRHLHGRHGRRAVGAGLQRAALHHEVAAHGRRPTRSIVDPGPRSRSTTTYVCVERVCPCAKPATTRSTARSIISAGTTRLSRPCVVAPGDDDPVRLPRFVRRPAWRRRRRWPTWRRSTSARSTRSSGPIFVDGAEPGDALKVTHRAQFVPSGLRLDRQHPGLRAARRPVHGAGAARLDL